LKDLSLYAIYTFVQIASQLYKSSKRITFPLYFLQILSPHNFKDDMNLKLSR